MKLFQAGLATGWQPEPVIDGVVLNRQLADTFARGEQAKVPVLAGFNEGEIRSLLFLMPKAPDSPAAYEADVRRRFGAKASDFLAVYPGADPKADVMASIRDGLYGWAAQNLVRQQSALRQGAYLYFSGTAHRLSMRATWRRSMPASCPTSSARTVSRQRSGPTGRDPRSRARSPSFRKR